MDTPTLSFAQEQRAPASAPMPPVPRMWVFHPAQNLDLPFHGLLSHFGIDLIMDLDQIVLDTPRRAAVRATQVYQTYSARLGQQDQVREVMMHLANTLKPTLADSDEHALLPPEAVFRGRPRV